MSLLWDLVALKILLGDREKSDANKHDVNIRYVDESGRLLSGFLFIMFGCLEIIIYMYMWDTRGGTDTNFLLIFGGFILYFGYRLFHLQSPKFVAFLFVGFCFILIAYEVMMESFSYIDGIILSSTLISFFLFSNFLFIYALDGT